MARKKKSNDPMRNKKEWSVSEFQMWLAGAFSLQGEEWIPNAEQWEMIVDIVYKLKESEPELTVPRPQAMPPQRPPQGGFVVPPMPLTEPPVMTDSNPNPPFDPDDVPAEAKMSLDALRNLSHEGNGTMSTGKSVKTPNIDTSQGYKSGFE